MNYKYENNDYLAPISETDIALCENSLRRRFPKELRDFWVYHGCGIIEENPDEVHRLFSPSETLDFISFKGYYSILEDKDYYRSISGKGIVIMEYDQETFFWISTEMQTYGKVFFYDKCIADSFDDLICKIHNHVDLY